MENKDLLECLDEQIEEIHVQNQKNKKIEDVVSDEHWNCTRRRDNDPWDFVLFIYMCFYGVLFGLFSVFFNLNNYELPNVYIFIN